MKVAFATSDLAVLDEKFRRASRLVVYELGPSGSRQVAVHAFPPDRAVKTAERMDAIAGVSIVFGVAFLPSTVARLARQGIRAATAPSGTTIASLLEDLAGR